MSSIQIAGDTSGSITLQAPAVAGTTTLTLPTTNGTVIVGSGGVTSVASGGTGASTLTSNNVILGNGTSAVQFVAPGTSGNALVSNGTTWTSGSVAAFPSGTRMAFQQTSAPTGWTQDTTAALNDSIMRIVTGTTGSGGSVAFSTWAAQTSTGAYTLAIADIPSHTHTIPNSGSSGGAGLGNTSQNTTNTGAQGGGGAHSHSLSQSVKYYDFIIASKN